MKTDATHTKKLNALLRDTRKRFKPEPPDAMNPISQLIMAFLEWNATNKQAEKAMDRLTAEMVDNNDLRVTYQKDMIALVGKDYPLIEDRVARLRESLQDIFLREHGMAMDTLGGKNKKEVRTYLDTLGGIPQYVAAKVMLLCFGGHAIPVDEKLATLLLDEGVVPEGASIPEIASFLERHIKAADGVTAHVAFKAWADSKRRKIEPFAPTPVVPPEPVAAPPAPPKKKAAKAKATKAKTTKTTKTKTTKTKTTKKKTAAKKTSTAKKKKVVRKK